MIDVGLEAKAPREGGDDGGGGDVAIDDAAGTRDRPPRIRCPLCMWAPRASDRWACYCGCSFHTFDTGARCPDCGFRYEQTMCLACHRWSKHVAWYVDGPPS